MVVGPWNHGGWSRGIGDRLGPIKFDQPTAWQFREKIEVPFFAHYLKDRPLDLDKDIGRRRAGRESRLGNGHAGLPEVISFRTGANVVEVVRPLAAQGGDGSQALSARGRPPGFRASARCRRPAMEDRALMSISRTRPGPCPTTAGRSRRSISILSGPSGWSRTSGLCTCAPTCSATRPSRLTQDLDVAGPVLARLFASTSGTDSDWIVKLIDVYPEDAPQPLAGYQLMIANDVFRGRFRKSFEHPEPIVAGKSRSTRSTCTGPITALQRGTRSWCRSRARGFR